MWENPLVQVVTRALALLALGLALAAPSAAAPGKARETVLATAGPDRRETRLVELDRVSLRPTGRSLDARGFHGAWSYSPDGTRLALSNSYVPNLGRPAGVMLVDVRRLRMVKRILVPGELGFIRALSWVAPQRVLVLVVESRTGTTLALALDLERGIVERRPLDGIVMGGRSLPSGFVLLAAPESGIGPARLLTVDAGLRVRSVTLDAIRAGSRRTGKRETHTLTQRRPALVVDDAGGRAFVLGADEPAAEVDLATLRATFHAPTRRLQARSKSMAGPVRYGEWLGDGRIGVSGTDYDGLDPKTLRTRQQPAGLTLLDTRTWTATLVDEQAEGFGVVGSTIVVAGKGLAGFSRDGRLLWRALEGRLVDVHVVHGERVYAQPLGERGLRIFDARTGRELGRRLGAIPRLLTARASPIW